MKKSLWLIFGAALVFGGITTAWCDEKKDNDFTVACYYFPNYHPGDKRNTKQFGPEWNEWKLVKEAKPRFEGHQQPKVPLWGYEDESDPKVMAKKIDAAADHGVDAFIFDWYWYDDGPFLDKPLDQAFLTAPNNNRVKFALMWANCDWVDIHPYTYTPDQKKNLLYPGKVTPETFNTVCDFCIEKYFKHPSYWKIDGKPYFSFYDLTRLMESFGSVEATRKALDEFRAKAKAAGLPGVHLNAIVWGRPILPGEQVVANKQELVKQLGFDSVTSYVWTHHTGLPELKTDYKLVQDRYFKYWDIAEEMFDVPYYPNVTMGWDSSPRTDQSQEFNPNYGYPYSPTIAGNTPERFQEALAATKEKILKDGTPKILNINCWNEWTEGSYLEPDKIHGMKYLEAVKNVFGPNTPSK